MPSTIDQIRIILRLLENRTFDITTEHGRQRYDACLTWVQRWPSDIDAAVKDQLTSLMQKSFGVSEIDIIRRVNGGIDLTQPKLDDPDEKLRAVLPKGGWFEWYDQWTRYNESPLSYHIFSSLSILGASLGRRVWKNQGFFDVFPNYCVILVGPTGIKKTSATDIAKSYIKNTVLCPIMADAITPESLATTLVKSGHHFIYAPEMSVFFGKQKYNEALTTRIIRLLDCPAEWKVETVTRGEELVTDIALTFLGCSTLSLLAGSSASDVTSSGFLNRFVVVVETQSERCFPEPRKGPPSAETNLLRTIERVRSFSGEMIFNSHASKLYDSWYRQRKEFLKTQEEIVIEVLQRSATHIIRTAMLMHLAECDTMCICESCLQHSIDMINYVEASLPNMMRSLKSTGVSQDLEYVVMQIYRNGGAIDHSSLLRKVGNRMNATQMRSHINTLKEAGRIIESRRGPATFYILKEDLNANN